MSQHLILFTSIGPGDKIPDALNWTDISESGFAGETNTQTITGISTSIGLKVTFGGVNELMYYSLNGGGPLILISGDVFTVSNGDTVKFIADRLFDPVSDLVTVLNNSDSDTVLDTFNVTLTD